eukprot:1160554-Pelagomonas_calceolata.AAC.2
MAVCGLANHSWVPGRTGLVKGIGLYEAIHRTPKCTAPAAKGQRTLFDMGYTKRSVRKLELPSMEQLAAETAAGSMGKAHPAKEGAPGPGCKGRGQARASELMDV